VSGPRSEDLAWPSGKPFASSSIRRAALSGRVAVVTGASRGLGASLATHFAAAGLRLGLCARHRPELVAATRPRAHDGRVEPPEPPLVAAVDVRHFAALADFAEAVIDRFGRIDLWVNNAAVAHPMGPLVTLDPAELADHVAVNLEGTAFASMLFARHVRQRPGEGVLINVTSDASIRAYAGLSAFGATKAGLDQLTAVVAVEERTFGLRAYAVDPGVVATDLDDSLAADPSVAPATAPALSGRGSVASSAAWVADRFLDLAFGDDPPAAARLQVPPERPPRAR
jgi:NAD(P)-dependent dehydrogenase (short-subunit alcohol dehydrogenase family)